MFFLGKAANLMKQQPAGEGVLQRRIESSSSSSISSEESSENEEARRLGELMINLTREKELFS